MNNTWLNKLDEKEEQIRKDILTCLVDSIITQDKTKQDQWLDAYINQSRKHWKKNIDWTQDGQ